MIATSCRSAGLHPGCCSWLSNNCRANGGCYCDRACSLFNDCCSDVPRGMQCSPLPGEVRTISENTILKILIFSSDIMNQVQYEEREPSQVRLPFTFKENLSQAMNHVLA